jgi:hypothetical protein
MKVVLYFILLVSGIQALKFKNHRRYKHILKKSDCLQFDEPEPQQQHEPESQPKPQPQSQPQSQPKPQQQSESESQPEPQQQSEKNNSGGLQTTSKATFYFRVGPDVEGCPAVQTFNDGMSYGPCNGNQGVKYTSESKYWAAIKNASGRCGETITVNYNGKSMNLKVMDECPGCGEDNHVDMGLDALIELTGSKESACAIGTTQPIITWS